MKKKYEKFRMELVDYTPESSILAGSPTEIEMVVDEVTVEPFQDGFESQGGFETINFD